MWKVFDSWNNDRQIVLDRALNDLTINLVIRIRSPMNRLPKSNS